MEGGSNEGGRMEGRSNEGERRVERATGEERKRGRNMERKVTVERWKARILREG